MAKYLAQRTYTPDGLKALRAGGASQRVAEVHAFAARLGGSLELLYFAFGDSDVYMILDLPDDEAAAALTLAVNEAGQGTGTIVKLLTAEQIDTAFTRTVAYRPPGQ